MNDFAWFVMKAAGWLLSPLTAALLLGLAGAVLAWRKGARWGGGCGAVALAGLWLVGSPAVATWLAAGLEERYPPVTASAAPSADAAVILGGGMHPANPPAQPQLLLGPSAGRVWHGASLYHAGKVRWLVVSGGGRESPAQSEAAAMREMLLALGVPDRAIRIEPRSRNTEENAGLSLPLLRELGARRVLVVTSALHMPRALAIFQRRCAEAGLTVLAASTDAGSRLTPPSGLAAWLPDATSLAWASQTVKERIGGLRHRLPGEAAS